MADYQPDSVDDSASVDLRRRVHQTIAKVDSDMLEFKWNTAVAALMTLRNELQHALRSRAVTSEAWQEGVEALLKLLAPIAPHITEELWRGRGNEGSIHVESWPVADQSIAAEDTVTMVLQVNGKVRDRIDVPVSVTDEAAEEAAFASDKIQQWVEGKEVRKVIVRAPKLVNIVVG